MARNIFRQPAVEIENIVRICNEKKIKERMRYLESLGENVLNKNVTKFNSVFSLSRKSFEKKVKDKEKSENNLEKKIKNNERTL